MQGDGFGRYYTISILNGKDENPFEMSPEDIDMAAPIFMGLDSDMEDDDIGIYSLFIITVKHTLGVAKHRIF